MKALRWSMLFALLAQATAALGAPFAYIAGEVTGNVEVLDIATNTVIATVPVANLSRRVAVDPTGAQVFLTTLGGNLAVLDTATNTITDTVPLGFHVNDVAVNAAGTRVILARSPGPVTVLDAASHAVVATVPVAGRYGWRVVAGPSGVYVLSLNDSGVFTVDVLVGECLAGAQRITLPEPGTSGFAINPAGTRLYVTNAPDVTSPGSVSVIDIATGAVVATVPVGPRPGEVAVNPAGTRVYVVNSGGLSVIDTATNAVVATVPGVSPNSLGIAVNPAGTRVYAINTGGRSVSVIDTATNSLVATVPVPSGPAGIAIGSGVVPPPPDGDPANVEITGIEVTQGIQDLANSVPLIAGRKTFVRVHARSVGPAVAGVTATLSGAVTTCTLIGNVCSTAQLGWLNPVNLVGPRLTIGPGPIRTLLDDSFLFELPPNWTANRSVALHAELTTTAGAPRVSSVCDVLNAPLYGLEYPRFLKIQFVRMSYSLAGTTVEASEAEQQQSESFIRRTYPVSSLVPTPDLPLFDAGLGSRVDRSADECQDMPVGSRNTCADRYIQSRLDLTQALTGFLGLLRQRAQGSHELNGWPGDADGAYALIPQTQAGQCAPRPDGTLPCFTRGSCCTNRIGTGPSNSVGYAAHEIGHLLGRQHPVAGASTCGHDAVDPDYPYLGTFIGALDLDTAGLVGFDPGDPTLGPPVPIIRTRLTNYDFMGYCNPDWTSDYTYNAIGLCLREVGQASSGTLAGCGAARSSADGADAQFGDWLAVFGNTPTEPGAAAFLQTERVERIVSVPPRTPGDHSIRLIGDGGATLADYPFAPELIADAASADGASAPPRSFGHVVPFVAGTREIRIVDTSTSMVIGAKTISPNPPVITDVALQGEPDPDTGSVMLGWTASDPDGDSLTFDVFLTRDGGASFLEPLMLGVSETSIQIETAHLGGGTAQFQVRASDGVQTAAAHSPPFVLANKPPQPRIVTPGDGATIHLGQLLNLEGGAADPQDGVIAETGLAWSIPGRSLGSGSQVSVMDLPLGTTVLTLTATNSLGLVATATASITVDEVVDQPGPTLTVGPGQIGWHVAAGESQLQTAELNVGNSGSGDLQFTAQSDAPWLTLSPAGGTAPATLTLTGNPAGFAEGTTGRASVTLTAVGFPNQAIAIPVTLAAGNTFVVGETPPTTSCGNGLDDDADGFADLDDPGCVDASDASEKEPTLPCDDGLDNDADGFSDYPNDPGCPALYAAPENPSCDDGIDNNGDGLFDLDDPNCSAGWPYWEVSPCGLGAELAPVLAGLHLLRRRRAATRSAR